jgi:DNA processing protein
VIVVEAGAKSGTLRTVDYALEQGRDVYCVPGNVTSSTSRGTNRLIKEGAAAMMTCAEDVWQNYSPAPLVRPAAQSPARTEDPEERRLLLALKEPKRADELIAQGLTELNIADLLAKLSFLEIKGLIRQLPGKYYQTVIRSIRA